MVFQARELSRDLRHTIGLLGRLWFEGLGDLSAKEIGATRGMWMKGQQVGNNAV